MEGIDVMRIPSGPGGPGTGLRVHAPARLHFGFLDLHGGLGRRFGSIGLALDAPAVTLTARPAERLDVTGPEARRAAAYALAAAGHLGIAGHAALAIESAIPAHAGFGSGTQLALSVAAALAGLAGRPFAPEDFAERPRPGQPLRASASRPSRRAASSSMAAAIPTATRRR